MKRKMRLKFYEAPTTKKVSVSNGVKFWRFIGRWRWRLTASNGRIVLASTEGYATKAGAKRNWNLVRSWLASYSKTGTGIEVIE